MTLVDNSAERIESMQDVNFGNIEARVFEEGMTSTDAVILDVRTPMEFQSGHLENAVLLDFNNPAIFIDGLEDLDKDKRYYVYCRSGVRSAAACAMMRDRGFSAAFNLIGGIMGWEGPVVK